MSFCISLYRQRTIVSCPVRECETPSALRRLFEKQKSGLQAVIRAAACRAQPAKRGSDAMLLQCATVAALKLPRMVQ